MSENKGPGRPVLYTSEVIEEIKQAMNDYTDKTAIPILAEFAFLYGIRRQTLYDQPDLSDSTKRMMEKKEFQTEKMALAGKVNPSFAIFSLKQMGWRDRFEHEHTGNLSIGRPPTPEEAEFPE